MEIYISQKEYDSFSKKLSELEKEREKSQKMLGKIMETSGSFATPLSPIGQCLMGKKVDKEIKIELPKGDLQFKIISIEKKLL